VRGETDADLECSVLCLDGNGHLRRLHGPVGLHQGCQPEDAL